MKCPLCNQDIRDESKFCTKCGRQIPRCPSCGRVIYRRIRFCVYDGTPLPEELVASLPEPDLGRPVDSEKISGKDRLGTAGDKGDVYAKKISVHRAPPDRQEFDEEEYDREENKQSVLPILIVVAVITSVLVVGAICLALFHDEIFPTSQVQEESSSEDAREETQEESEASAGASDTGEESAPAETGDAASVAEMTEGEQAAASESEPTAAIIETLAPTAPSAESTAPTAAIIETQAPTTVPPANAAHSYEVIAGDISWQDARTACEEKGGHLVTVNSQEEYDQISKLASKSGLTYLWLGACLHSDTETWEEAGWITGEPWGFSNWYPGEPSRMDADGTKEYYLCLWNAKYNDTEMGWTFNDQRNDLVADYSSVSGKIGYICEYEPGVSE